MELGERKLKILAAIVDLYVKTGEPISSKALCDLSDFSLSSATIRNEMAELTELGYLEQPHTSAGRIPSHLGYRLYINQLMGKKDVPNQSKEIIDNSLTKHSDSPESLLNKASALLAQLTNLAVISTTLSAKFDTIKEIQFIKTGNHTGLVLVITSTGFVKNRFFRCEYVLTEDIIKNFYRIFNEKFSGIPLIEITEEFIDKIALSLGEIIHLVDTVLIAIFDTIVDIVKLDIHLEGQANLLLFPDFSSNSIVDISNFLKKGNNITNFILNINDNNTKVLFGKETPFEQLSDSSIILTNYAVKGKNLGVIGLIGPVRMDYGGTIASLEYIASSIGDSLSKFLDIDQI